MGGNSYRQALGYHIADVLLHLPQDDWSAHFKKNDAELEAEEKRETTAWEAKRVRGTHPSHDLGAYAATYSNQVDGKAAVTSGNGHLTLIFHGHTTTLEHFEYDTFLVPSERHEDVPSRLTFHTNADGEISGLDFAGAHFERTK